MKWVTAILVPSFALLCSCVSTGPKKRPTLRTAASLSTSLEPVRVVCLGDSVTGVYYHTGGRRAYPEMLEVALNRLAPKAQVRVLNAGISGNTTVDALKRLDTDVLAHKPHLVTVMFGLNDMSRVPIEQYEANLTTIIEKCRAADAEVLLCTPNAIMDTQDRPTAKLLECIAAIHRVGERTATPVADCYATCDALRTKDAFEWFMTMSDEIHPSMTGHKLMAETIAKTITGKSVSLTKVGPLEPGVPKTLALLENEKTIKIHAMPPYDRLIPAALKNFEPNAQFDVSTWIVEGKSVEEIRETARSVRALKPDLVVVAVPAAASASTKEQFVHAYKWVLNDALSFGHQEWDCIAITPTVSDQRPDIETLDRVHLAREIIWAQDLPKIERKTGDRRSPEEILTSWLRIQTRDAVQRNAPDK
jgi:lysophospholipase L1-like esterase